MAIQVDPAYYHMPDPNYSKFADAVMDVGPSPCQKFNCSRQEECKLQKVECKAFRYWVNNGSLTTMRKVNGKKTEVSIEQDITRILRIIE